MIADLLMKPLPAPRMKVLAQNLGIYEAWGGMLGQNYPILNIPPYMHQYEIDKIHQKYISRLISHNNIYYIFSLFYFILFVFVLPYSHIVGEYMYASCDL
jgi:hypothetical protein